MSEFDPKKAQLLHPELLHMDLNSYAYKICEDHSRKQSILPLILLIIAFAAAIMAEFVPSAMNVYDGLAFRVGAIWVAGVAGSLATVIYVYNRLQKIIEQNNSIIENQKIISEALAAMKKNA